MESTCSPCQHKKIYMNFFWSKTTKNPYQKNSKNFGREKQGKKNVKKPYFSGDKKNCQKTLFFRREKKCQKPLLKKNSKNFYSQIHCKKNSKNFGHFLVVKIMSFSLEKVWKKVFWKKWKKKFFLKKNGWTTRTRTTTRRKCLKRKYVIFIQNWSYFQKLVFLEKT